ncbi:MAG TPA: TfoX/Sxy family protein [Roseiarcus sp.]|jgi:TfoX/Sxy family transcriptional regulator of competence genes
MSAESDLASRVRAALHGVEALREVKMFGGVGFMVNGNLVAAASKRGLLLRIGKERQDEALAQPGIRPMEMRGRRMEGYVYADPPPAFEDAIKTWLRLALDYVGALPPKPDGAGPKRTKRQVAASR